MTISQSSTGLIEPVGPDKISRGTFGYICSRNRQRQYNIVIREFRASGITQKELCARLGSTPDVISRLLARPGNWEADTFAKLMFAISGAVPTYRAEHPFRRRLESELSTPMSQSPSRQENAKPDLKIIGLIRQPAPLLPQAPVANDYWANQLTAMAL